MAGREVRDELTDMDELRAKALRAADLHYSSPQGLVVKSLETVARVLQKAKGKQEHEKWVVF